jgi:hypothetical protein
VAIRPKDRKGKENKRSKDGVTLLAGEKKDGSDMGMNAGENKAVSAMSMMAGESVGKTDLNLIFVERQRRPAMNALMGEKIEEPDMDEDGGEKQREETEEEAPQGEEESDSEEAAKPKTVHAPKGPTRKEREEHEATHMPYRAWCQHCIRGRGRNKPHKRKTKEAEDEEKKVPRVSMDYFFMSQDEEKASENPLLLMVDESTGLRYMRAVGRKGTGDGKEMEWLIKDLHEELKDWGHPGGEGNELILKSDGEPAIVAVREALGRYHGGKVLPEQAPRGESASNGRVEEAGKTVRGLVKVLKDQLETKTALKIQPKHIILQWMVRWAAMMYSRFKVGEDGKTPYERLKGRKCNVEVVPFGETVMYKKLKESGQRKLALESAWELGVWLGHARRSNEVLIGTKEGVLKAWAIKRRPEEERWDGERVQAIQGTPQRPDPNMPGIDIPIRIQVSMENMDAPTPMRDPRVEEHARRAYLKKEDFEKHGYTEGCEGCRRAKTGGMTARPHTEACRVRLEKLLEEESNPRWKRAKEQKEEMFWDAIREEDKKLDDEEAAKKAREEERSGGMAARGSGMSDEERQRGAEEQRSAEEESAAKRSKVEETRGEKRKEEKGQQSERDKRKKKDEDEEAEINKRKQERQEEAENKRRREGIARVTVPDRGNLDAQMLKFGISETEIVVLKDRWDLRKVEDREAAVEYVRQYKPWLVVGSLMG